MTKQVLSSKDNAFCPILRAGVTCLVTIVCMSQAWLVHGEDVSSPAILQMYEARWSTIEDRMADIHAVGYGRMWIPPAARAGSVFSVGYDVFDRFDLGNPSDQTHYGTSEGFRSFVNAAHNASVKVNPDLIWNHNGVGNRNDANFVTQGGYPGFALTLPNDINGDFHDPFIDALLDDQILGQLAGLNDIGQEKNHQFIRNPVDPSNPNNIPAGTLFNQANPNNARFYTDLQGTSTSFFHPQLGTNVTRYDFNASDPLAGDPIMENATGLLMRNVQWMIQEYDIDGFRLDAARHFPRWVLDFFDQSTFLAKRNPLLDGSPDHVYSFSETGFDSAPALQDYIRRDIDNNNLGTLGGNRDVLDFRLFNAIKDNLTGNGAVNNWHNIRNASMDLNDDGLMNGSQGVVFVQSHDETGAFLGNTAHAYALMLPGETIVYLNSEEYGDTGTFPQPGKDDALGGFYGETITKLVGIRNTHGRGNFQERWIDDAFNPSGFSNVYVYERENSAIVGLNSRNDTVTETRTGVQTGFAPDTILVELTGNAADPTVDPGGTIPDSVKVNASGQIDISIPANNPHGRGYVIYGLATPEGTLSLTNVASTLSGATQTASTFGTARLADIDVITSNTFDIQLTTNPVSVPDPDNPGSTVRDEDADGDFAVLKINGGIDLNSNVGVDFVTPDSVTYGFENFTDTNIPGYIDDNGSNIGTGTGTFSQTVDIDAVGLGEGRHYITTRVFRHRDSGPAVFQDFKKTIYIDRVAPESEIVSFDPYGFAQEDLDLVVGSVDDTASEVNVLMNLPATLSDAQILGLVNGGNSAFSTGGGEFVFRQDNVIAGNHVATVVMKEVTGSFTIRRFVGLSPDTGLGGLGDTDLNGFIGPADMLGFESVLYSQNTSFSPAADANGDGLVDNRDLFQLDDELLANGASQPALDQYLNVLDRRGDLDDDDTTTTLDIVELYNNFGLADTHPDFWLMDMNVDGVVDEADVAAVVTEIIRSELGDFDLDGDIDGADFLVLQRGLGTSNAQYIDGDADLDGDVDAADVQIWQTNYRFQTPPFEVITINAGSVSVPEPGTGVLLLMFVSVLFRRELFFKDLRE